MVGGRATVIGTYSTGNVMYSTVPVGTLTRTVLNGTVQYVLVKNTVLYCTGTGKWQDGIVRYRTYRTYRTGTGTKVVLYCTVPRNRVIWYYSQQAELRAKKSTTILYSLLRTGTVL